MRKEDCDMAGRTDGQAPLYVAQGEIIEWVSRAGYYLDLAFSLHWTEMDKK